MSRPRHFAFLDLETTGTDASRDRITEVGVVWMMDGLCTGEWSTLINPGVAIPPPIQALTGINNGMVREAPGFERIADDLGERLKGCILVAHNARFDYGFLKAAYRRLGRRFQADVLCTVRLSRQLFPQFSRHGLDALVARYRLGAEARHRALGDARLIAEFFRRLPGEVGHARLQEVLDRLLRQPARPANLPEDALDDLPESAGVYTFLGVNRQPLYIGKARNLRDRVRAHFHADSSNSTDTRLATEVHGLEIEETAGEFCALIREAQLIRQQAPLHNIALRRKASTCFVRLPGADRKPTYLPLESFNPKEPEGLHGPFGSKHSARAALATIAKDYRLCDRAIGLWTGDRPCFSRQIGRCLGLCCNEERPEDHHRRLLDAMQPLHFPAWPFQGMVRFTETDPLSGRTQSLYFEDWCAIDESSLAPAEFHPEVFRLLRRRIATGPKKFELVNRN